MGTALDTVYKIFDQQWWATTILQKLDKRGVPVAEWISELNDGRTITEVLAELLASEQRKVFKWLLGMLIEHAEGPALSAFGIGFFQEPRHGMEFTEGYVLITNVSSPPRDVSTRELIVGTPGAGASAKTYRNVGPFKLPPIGGSVEVLVIASEAGESYNVASGAITDLKTPIPGVRVSNPPRAPAITWISKAGRDEEGDGSVQPPMGYKGRLISKWAITGLGTAESYRFFALSKVAGRNSSPATRAEPASSYDPDRKTYRPNCVCVFVAGPAGPLPPAEVALVADNYEQPVQRYPLDVKLFVRSATGRGVDIDGTVYYYLTADRADIESGVAEATAFYQRDVRIGVPVFSSETVARVQKSNPNVQSYEPGINTNIPIAPGEIPVFVLSPRLRYVGVPVV